MSVGNIRQLLNNRKLGIHCPFLGAFIREKLVIDVGLGNDISAQELYQHYIAYALGERTDNDGQTRSMITKKRFFKVCMSLYHSENLYIWPSI